MLKEICLGATIAVVLFLLFLGYNIFPLLILGGLVLFLYVLMERQGIVPGVQKQVKSVKNLNFTFEEIGGQAPAKQELQEALNFVLEADKTIKMGIRPLKGILLTGPPGTGKTLMAKAAASFIDSVFLAASGSEFIEVYAGIGAQRIRQLFKKARDKAVQEKKSGAVIFIDEIDVLGSRRGTHAGHMEYEQTLNQLLVEMDGLESNKCKILVIGATNREDMLDPALLRPGRFDRIVRVDLPDKEARLQILKLHCRNKPLAEDVKLAHIASESFGFSGAHLESVANEAAILALREKSPLIYQKHFKEAVDKVMMGEKLDKKPIREEMRRVAVHETGHAVLAELLRPGSVSHLTVTSRGRALGYMRQLPEDDAYLYTLEALENQIQVLLAGAVSEEMLLSSKSTGASSDFRQSVKLARQIIHAGLSDLGVVCEDALPDGLLHKTIQNIIKIQEEKVKEILLTKKQIIAKIAELLLDKEVISGSELRENLAN